MTPDARSMSPVVPPSPAPKKTAAASTVSMWATLPANETVWSARSTTTPTLLMALRCPSLFPTLVFTVPSQDSVMTVGSVACAWATMTSDRNRMVVMLFTLNWGAALDRVAVPSSFGKIAHTADRGEYRQATGG